MENRTIRIDLVKFAIYILKRSWILALCGAVGFGLMYWRTARNPDTYTASGTMYTYNGNPNMVNYQYISQGDLNAAMQLLDTYMVVIRSDKVMNTVTERLARDYPGIDPSFISGTLSMGSVSETGVMRVRCTTLDPKMSADICNAVLDVAPAEIIRVVGAGNIEIIDYAVEPLFPNSRSFLKQGLIGALAGMVLAGGILLLLFLLNRKVRDTSELTNQYTPPVLSSIRRDKKENRDPASFLLQNNSPMDVQEAYAKLRMNLLYTLAGKESKTVIVTSALSGEGKSTVTANLAISCALSGKRVLLIDADMRRACQRDIFHYAADLPGLSDVLIKSCRWQEALLATFRDTLQILPAGQFPPNPAELLSTPYMTEVLREMEQAYDLILLDMPPINIVSDPLVLSTQVAGCVLVIRQDFSDHREIRKALISAEMTDMNVLGFIFYGEKIQRGNYYSRKYYKNYSRYYEHSGSAVSGKSPALGSAAGANVQPYASVRPAVPEQTLEINRQTDAGVQAPEPERVPEAEQAPKTERVPEAEQAPEAEQIPERVNTAGAAGPVDLVQRSDTAQTTEPGDIPEAAQTTEPVQSPVTVRLTESVSSPEADRFAKPVQALETIPPVKQEKNGKKHKAVRSEDSAKASEPGMESVRAAYLDPSVRTMAYIGDGPESEADEKPKKDKKKKKKKKKD